MLEILLAVAISTAPQMVGPIRPQNITDGDTFTLPSGEKIRIANIDTPEKGARAKCDAEKFLAVHARARLEALLAVGNVEITRLPPQAQRDPWGRTLARVRARGQDVGDHMIAAVLAVRWEGRRHAWCSGIR